ncbi:MAG TPA: FtsX-like permease family protein, partial [Deinococcales bacterium]|nr:FtsX-like permease family protein [Deinococcales bacterium]
VARTGGNALVILLVLNTLFNILNTIRVAMYARRDEINVMRLIGATRGFIRAPYVLEGVGMALLAAAVTSVLVYPAYSAGARALQNALPFLPLTSDPVLTLEVLGIVAALGLLIGFLGSLVAANRYLREVE